jgi:hypothetical protein
MHRTILGGLLLLLAGCQNLVGPRERRDNPVRVDDPRLSIPEQERLGRDRLALPEWSRTVVPRTYADLPGPSGH